MSNSGPPAVAGRMLAVPAKARFGLANCECTNGPPMHSHTQTWLPVFGKYLQRAGPPFLPGEKDHFSGYNTIFQSISKDHCGFSSRIFEFLTLVVRKDRFLRTKYKMQG